MPLQTQQCPWCGNGSPHARFMQSEPGMRAEKQQRLAENERILRKQLSQEKEAAEKIAKQRAAEQIAAATAERDVAFQKLKDAEVRENLIRTQVRDEALREAQEQKQQELNGQRVALQTEINAVRSRLAAAEASEATIRMQAQAEAAMAAQAALESERENQKELESKMLALEAARELAQSQLAQAQAREMATASEAEERAQQRARAAVEEAEREKQKELNDLRAILQAAQDQAVLKAQVGFSREKEDLEKKVLEVQHELKKMRANEIGEGAEVDLFETLKGAFEEDNITRVKKGQPGPDLIHEVRHNGMTCGTIIYDSKHRQDWNMAYATNLRQTHLKISAQHALLSATVFPSGEKQLSIQSGIIVINPEKVVYMVQLLREQMVAMHVRGLSLNAKTQKTERLYALITSSAFTQRLHQATQMIEQMLEIDAEEVQAHERNWKRRGILLKRQSAVLRELDTEVNAIVEGTDESKQPAA